MLKTIKNNSTNYVIMAIYQFFKFCQQMKIYYSLNISHKVLARLIIKLTNLSKFLWKCHTLKVYKT